MRKKSIRRNNLKKSEEKKSKLTLIHIIIIVAIVTIIGNLIYQIVHWREAVDGFKELGIVGSITVVAIVILVRKLIDSL